MPIWLHLCCASLLLAQPLTEARAQTAPRGSSLAIIAVSDEYRVLTRAIAQAGLGETLSGAASYTIFAPVDAAFARLAAGDLDRLLAPANRTALIRVLAYHIIPEALDGAALKARIAAGGGAARLKTLQGELLVARVYGGAILLSDPANNSSYVIRADIRGGDGVIHAVNGLLLPRLR